MTTMILTAALIRTILTALTIIPKRDPRQPMTTNDRDYNYYVLTLDDLVAFARAGWHYPLEDDVDTRDQIVEWLTKRAIESSETA